MKKQTVLILIVACIVYSCTSRSLKKEQDDPYISNFIEVLNILIESTNKNTINHFPIVLSFDTGYKEPSTSTALKYWARSDTPRLNSDEKAILHQLIQSKKGFTKIPFSKLSIKSQQLILPSGIHNKEIYKINIVRFEVDKYAKEAVLLYETSYRGTIDSNHLISSGAYAEILFFNKKENNWHITNCITL
jgi:hypothetical protein